MGLLLPKLFPCEHEVNSKSLSQGRWVIRKYYPAHLFFTSDQKLAGVIGENSNKVVPVLDEESENGEEIVSENASPPDVSTSSPIN